MIAMTMIMMDDDSDSHDNHDDGSDDNGVTVVSQ